MGLAAALHAILTRIGLYRPADAPSLQASTVLAALAEGVGGTAIAAIAAGGAALRAARSRPWRHCLHRRTSPARNRPGTRGHRRPRHDLRSVPAGAAQQVGRELAALLTAYPQATLSDQAGYSQQVSTGINLIANLMTGLLALSLLIGHIAVTTALALSVLERTRETGLLRAIGATARQIRSTVRAEALATVTTGAITGLILGLAIGWPLARAIDVYIVGPPGAPATLLAVAVPAASYLAAAIPARRAARLPILTARHTE